ncbi:MAG: Trm112 family protein [Micromonosporaceae bacterium]
MALEDALLGILVCPIDKRGLLYFPDEASLYNPRLRRLYRIEDDVPLMLADEAQPVPEEEHKRLLKRAACGDAIGTVGEPAHRIAADNGLAPHT